MKKTSLVSRKGSSTLKKNVAGARLRRNMQSGGSGWWLKDTITENYGCGRTLPLCPAIAMLDTGSFYLGVYKLRAYLQLEDGELAGVDQSGSDYQ